MDGAILVQARADKETALLIQSWLSLAGVVGGGCDRTGGRWSDKAVDILRQLAFAKARESPPSMKWPVVLAWERRWTRMLAARL